MIKDKAEVLRSTADANLFSSILYNSCHVLHKLLPTIGFACYSM